MWFLLLLALCLTPALDAQEVIAHVADGGGWQTTFALTNTLSSAAAVTLKFHKEVANGATQDWSPALSSSPTVTLAPGSTQFITTTGAASEINSGWVEVQGSTGVEAFAIFTQRAAGKPDQSGTSVADAPTARVLIPFDNTNGTVTAIAFANPSGAAAANIQTRFRVGTDDPFSGAILSLPAEGHASFTFPDKFPQTAGKRGLAEFTVDVGTSATFATLALRFNSSNAFTSSPLYKQTGAAVLSASPTGPVSTFNITNRLIYPVEISANGKSLGQIAASSTAALQASISGTPTVGWSLVRPTLAGNPLGDAMSGTLSLTSGSANTYSATINNVVDGQAYFAPLINNQVNQSFLIGANMGLGGENRCNCLAVAQKTTDIGYYRLLGNANLRGYIADSNYTGLYFYWGSDPSTPQNAFPTPEAGTGIVRLVIKQTLPAGN